MAQTILLIALVCIAIALVGLVLIQQGKGADAGASFGGGASQTVFGSAGSGNFLTKSTWTLGLLFFACCLALGYLARQQAENAGRIDFSAPAAQTQQQKPVPASSGGDVPAMPSSDAKSSSAPAKAAGSSADVPQAPAQPKTDEKPASSGAATDTKGDTAPKS